MNGNSDGVSLELDSATAQIVEHLASAWGVSKEEAVRRAVIEAEASATSGDKTERIAAFEELQERLRLTPEKAALWQASIREARR